MQWGQMMNRNEKLADARTYNVQQCAWQKKKKKKKKKEKEADEKVSQVETKEGEEALRFFRRRDFETCLSALKSREIKEPRPKLGEHV